MAARDSTRPATTTDWSNLQVRKISKDGAKMQPNELRQNIIRDPSTIGLRPNRSESGPTKSWNTAFIARNNVIVRVAVAYVTPNVFAMDGRDGKNIFIAKAPIAERQISVKILGGVRLFKNMGFNCLVILNRYI